MGTSRNRQENRHFCHSSIHVSPTNHPLSAEKNKEVLFKRTNLSSNSGKNFFNSNFQGFLEF